MPPPRVYSTALTDVPQECLHTIFGLLAPKELAALALQSCYLRSVAQDSLLWERHCRARWPGARAELHGGSWCRLYQARAALPALFCHSADHLHTLSAAVAGAREEGAGARGAARGNPLVQAALDGRVFGEVMATLFDLGCCVARQPELKKTPEFRSVRRDLGWWLRERAQVVVAFVRGANELLQDGPRRWGGMDGSSSAMRRRSALAFMQELGLLSAAHPSVVEALQRQTTALDDTMRGSAEVALVERAEREEVPASHWWFHFQSHQRSLRAAAA